MIAKLALVVALLAAPADAGSFAVRGEQRFVGPEQAKPPWLVLTGCDLMEWYADEAGLPDEFDWMGWAESRCDNTAISPTGCCSGYWQIHHGWLRWDPEGAAACGATTRDDWRGADHASRQVNACMAVLVFDQQGFDAWQVCHGTRKC